MLFGFSAVKMQLYNRFVILIQIEITGRRKVQLKLSKIISHYKQLSSTFILIEAIYPSSHNKKKFIK